MSRCLQSCFESFYWNCIEEKFCFDDSIAAYEIYDDEVWSNSIGGGYINNGASLESLSAVTEQPQTNNNNNHLPDRFNSHRTVLTDLPILAPNIYEVFSKSMIFKSDEKPAENDSKSDISKPKPNSYYTGIVSKVTFADEKSNNDASKTEDVKFSDFEIMFQDEIFADHHMSKIEEEEEDENSSKQDQNVDLSDEGICMKEVPEEFEEKENLDSAVDKKIAEIIRTDSKSSIKSDSKKLEKSDSKTSIKSEKILNRTESRGILKTENRNLLRTDSSKSITKVFPSNKHLPRSSSALLLSSTDGPKVFARSQSRPEGLTIKRVDSLKNLENKNLKNVLSRLPQRSASFLSIPDLDTDEKPSKSKSHDILSSGNSDSPIGEFSQISKLPDTPVIIGTKLPKFFVETPEIPEYKEERTLQSMKSPDVIFPESDFSMPRYYGKSKAITALKSLEPTVHASKSLPDLHEAVTEKVNKRLVKLRTRLKPLVIRKSDDSIRTTGQL